MEELTLYCTNVKKKNKKVSKGYNFLKITVLKEMV